jgi:hypothetical protein
LQAAESHRIQGEFLIGLILARDFLFATGQLPRAEHHYYKNSKCNLFVTLEALSKLGRFSLPLATGRDADGFLPCARVEIRYFSWESLHHENIAFLTFGSRRPADSLLRVIRYGWIGISCLCHK